MIKTKKQSPEVLYATDRIIKVDGKDIAFLKQKAPANKRKRIRLCTHRDVKDNLHEMLIVYSKNSYFCPHKHPGKTISYHIIEGLADVVIFGENGDILDVIRMGEYRSGLKFYHRISDPYYYMPIVHSDFLIFQETIPGPFQPSDTIYAPWAPSEENQEDGQKFLEQLRKKIEKRIVVLGANGFIGGWLVKCFRDEQQYPVLAITSKDCDFLSTQETLQTLKDLNTSDIVVIAAAITRLRNNTLDGMLKNIQMTDNIIQAVAGKGVCQIVYLSSVDVYGCLERKFKYRGKIHEAFELKPDDYYGVGKVACESLLRNQCQDQGSALSVLRLPGVFGPGDQMKSLVGQFIRKASQEGKLTIFGQGEDLREYLYIDDVYSAVKESIERRLNDTINVISGKSYSIRQMVDIILEVLNTPCQLEFREIPDPANERIKNMEFDNTKLMKLLPGFKRHDLKESISEYVGFLKSQSLSTETVSVR